MKRKILGWLISILLICVMLPEVGRAQTLGQLRDYVRTRPADTSPSGANLLYEVADPNGSPASKKVTIDAILAIAHNHTAAQIASGTLDGDRLPAISTGKKGGVPATGTPTGKFLKDDGTWATGSGGGTWGSITGILSDQSDLNTALAGKAATTGTTSPAFQLDSGGSGPKLKNNSGTLEARNSGDSAYAPVQASVFNASAADGSRRLQLDSNTSRTPDASKNELFPVANKWRLAENGSDVGELVTDTKTQTLNNKSITAVFVDGHVDATNLTAGQVSNTVVYNTGQGAADVTLNLPAAAAGYNALFTVGTTVAANKWRVRAASTDKIYLMAADGTITAGSDNGYAGYSAAGKYPAIGQSFACWVFKTDNYDWICKPIGNIILTAE